MSRRRLPTRAWLALLVMPGWACTGTDSVAEAPTPGTVAHVGALPTPFEIPGRETTVAAVPSSPPSSATPASAGRDGAVTTERAVAATAGPDRPEASGGRERFADAAQGNRILAVGDSITNAIGPDHGGQLCADLGRRGWSVTVDAEQGRDIAAGRDVLERRLAADDWDAAIVNLGSNYRDDPAAYAADLRAILAALRPRPVIVVTVTEFEAAIAEVNYVIRELARDRERVWVVEWSERTRLDERLTGDDGLHLTDTGRDVLSAMLTAVAGPAPDGDASVSTGCVVADELPEPATLGTTDATIGDPPADTAVAADGGA